MSAFFLTLFSLACPERGTSDTLVPEIRKLFLTINLVWCLWLHFLIIIPACPWVLIAFWILIFDVACLLSIRLACLFRILPNSPLKDERACWVYARFYRLQLKKLNFKFSLGNSCFFSLMAVYHYIRLQAADTALQFRKWRKGARKWLILLSTGWFRMFQLLCALVMSFSRIRPSCSDEYLWSDVHHYMCCVSPDFWGLDASWSSNSPGFPEWCFSLDAAGFDCNSDLVQIFWKPDLFLFF